MSYAFCFTSQGTGPEQARTRPATAKQGVRSPCDDVVDVVAEYLGEGRRGGAAILEPVDPERVGDSLGIPVRLQPSAIAVPQNVGGQRPLRTPVREPDLARHPVVVEKIKHPEGQPHLPGHVHALVGEHLMRPRSARSHSR